MENTPIVEYSGYTVKLIKFILLQENKSFFNVQHNKVFLLDYYQYAENMLAEQIKSFKTYAEIETFINLSRKMSLNEWIESL